MNTVKPYFTSHWGQNCLLSLNLYNFKAVLANDSPIKGSIGEKKGRKRKKRKLAYSKYLL